MSDQEWVAPGSVGGPEHRPAPPPPPPATGAPPPPPGPAAHPRVPPPPPPGGHFGTEFRPGIIALRPLRIGDIYGGVIRMIRGNVAATIGLAFLTCLAFLIPSTALGLWLTRNEVYDPSPDSPLQAADLVTQVPTVGTLVATILLAGFLAYVVGQAVLGRKVTAGEVWNGARPHLVRLVGATLLIGVALTLGVLLVIVGPFLWLVLGAHEGTGWIAPVLVLLVALLVAIVLSLWLSTRLAFVTTTIVLERAGIGRAIARSWRLTGGRGFWRILGLRLLAQLIITTIAQIVTVPVMVVAVAALLITADLELYYLWQTLLAGFTGLITGALTTPFSAGIDGLLYVDQRIRREGLDVLLIQVANGRADPPWPAAAP